MKARFKLRQKPRQIRFAVRGLAPQLGEDALQLAGDPPEPIACEAYLGLARIAYQWNDLQAAQQYAHHCSS